MMDTENVHHHLMKSYLNKTTRCLVTIPGIDSYLNSSDNTVK